MTHNMQKNIAMVCLILMICPYIFCGIVIYILQLNNKAECQKHQQFIHSLTNIQLMNEICPMPYKQLNIQETVNISNVMDNTNIVEYYISAWVIDDNIPIYIQTDNTAEVLTIVNYNDVIEITCVDNNWFKVRCGTHYGYIERKYVSIVENEYQTFSIPDYPGFKSYMDYRTVNIPAAIQYKLLSIYGYTENGFRKVNGRYCIAIGSYFNTDFGQYIDLILENGTVIECIMGDLKADVHTENNNIFTSLNKCCSEFIVDTPALDPFVAKTGNISNSNPNWNSPVKYIKIYNKNFFDTIGE